MSLKISPNRSVCTSSTEVEQLKPVYYSSLNEFFKKAPGIIRIDGRKMTMTEFGKMCSILITVVTQTQEALAASQHNQGVLQRLLDKNREVMRKKNGLINKESEERQKVKEKYRASLKFTNQLLKKERNTSIQLEAEHINVSKDLETAKRKYDLMQSDLQKKNDQLADIHEQLYESGLKRQKIESDLQSQLEKRDAEFADLRSQLEKRHAEFADAQSQLEKSNTELAARNAEIAFYRGEELE